MSSASTSWSSAGWDCTAATSASGASAWSGSTTTIARATSAIVPSVPVNDEVEDVGADAGAEHPLVATDRPELLHRDEQDPEQHECDRGANHRVRVPPGCEGSVRS